MNQERLDFTPIMLSIPETAKRTGLSQYSLRKMVKQHEILCIRSGVKIYINYGMLLDLLSDPIRAREDFITLEKSF